MRQSVNNIQCSSVPVNRLTRLFNRVAYLNANHIHSRSLIALGCIDEMVIGQDQSPAPLKALQEFSQKTNDWLFGYFSYDLKNSIHPSLKSREPILWPLLHFFRPEVVIEQHNGICTIHYYPTKTSSDRLAHILAEIQQPDILAEVSPIAFREVVSKDEYLSKVAQIQREIQLGNIYEINYCIPYKAEVENLDAAALYKKLNQRTKAPFSVFYQDNERALMCGSPERYLKKQGSLLTSQPIKGTIRRGDGMDDDALKEQLRNDPKERAENIMITDLVRNDLSQVAESKTVNVDELCEIYTFRTVHQMISTISASLAKDKTAFDAIRASFPMGSMTGAPKISAMKLIDKMEACSRGLYSGSFGYFTPNGDFDFNVIIRSMLYNRRSGMLSFQVGSAITRLSDPVAEYNECLLKADALLKSTKTQVDDS